MFYAIIIRNLLININLREKHIEEKPDLIKSWRLWAGIIFLLVFLVVSTGQGELFQGALKAKPVLTQLKPVASPVGQTAIKPVTGMKTTTVAKPTAIFAQPAKTQTVLKTTVPYKYKESAAGSIGKMPNPTITYGPCDSYDGSDGIHYKQFCFDTDFSIFKEVSGIYKTFNEIDYQVYLNIINPEITSILDTYMPDISLYSIEPGTAYYPIADSGDLDMKKINIPARFHNKNGTVVENHVSLIRNGYRTEILLGGALDSTPGIEKYIKKNNLGGLTRLGIEAWAGEDWFNNLSSVEIKLKSNYVLWLNNIDGSMAVQRSFTNFGDFNCTCNGTGPQKCCGINPLQNTYGKCGDSTTNFCSSSTQGQGSVGGGS